MPPDDGDDYDEGGSAARATAAARQQNVVKEMTKIRRCLRKAESAVRRSREHHRLVHSTTVLLSVRDTIDRFREALDTTAGVEAGQPPTPGSPGEGTYGACGGAFAPAGRPGIDWGGNRRRLNSERIEKGISK